MENIEKILNELYIIDPSLKEREGEVRKIIESLLASKPEIIIDNNFVSQLREKLIEKLIMNKSSVFDIFMKKIDFVPAISIVSVLAILVIAPLIYYSVITPTSDDGNIIVYDDDTVIIKDGKGGIIISSDVDADPKNIDPKTIVAGFVKFESKEEFDDYLSQSSFVYGYSGFGIEREMVTLDEGPAIMAPMAKEAGAAERVSETNVQVAGIDEPDILKTDGKEIYFSPERRYYAVFEERSILPNHKQPETQIIKAFPVADLAKEAEIDKAGDLLLSDDTLIVLQNQGVFGYDVSDPKSPKEKWSLDLDSRNQIVQARLYNDKIYHYINGI